MQNHRALGSIKQMDLLKHITELDVQYYFIVGGLIFVIEFKYLISEKSGIADSINHNFGKIRIDSYNSLTTETILTFHNAIILIKSVDNNNKNEYCYNIFLEKG